MNTTTKANPITHAALFQVLILEAAIDALATNWRMSPEAVRRYLGNSAIVMGEMLTPEQAQELLENAGLGGLEL